MHLFLWIADKVRKWEAHLGGVFGKMRLPERRIGSQWAWLVRLGLKIPPDFHGTTGLMGLRNFRCGIVEKTRERFLQNW